MIAFIDVLSPTHMLVILVVALLLFGNRLPEVARSFGRAINEFKRGLREVETEIEETPPTQPKGRLDAPTQQSLPKEDAATDATSQTVARDAQPTEQTRTKP